MLHVEVHMLSLLALTALAADEPCYPHVYDARTDSAHFWVEWDTEIADEAAATVVLDALEQARTTYVDELGFRLTGQPIVLALMPYDDKGVSGQAQTRDCDGEQVPILEVHGDDFREDPRLDVVVHELAHATQYPYTGQWLASASRLWWWMEGCAVWLAQHGGDDRSLADHVDNYLRRPHLALHHGATAAFFDDQLSHMYGTAVVAQLLEEHHGGPDTVRATWEWAAEHPEADFWLPDVLSDLGIDWEAFWAEHLARLPTVDLSFGAQLDEGPVRVAEVTELPARVEPSEEDRPEALGLSVVRLEPGLGGRRSALQVSFEGDDDVDWHVVLVRTDGEEPGSPVLEYTPLTGSAVSGWLSDWDRRAEGFVVVSPETRELDAYEWSLSIELVDDPGPMASRVQLYEPPRGGCDTAPGAPAWLALLALIGLRRRST